MMNIILAWGGSLVLGVTTAGVFIHKYSPVIRKYLKITKEGVCLLDELLDAVQDDKITTDEIELLAKRVNSFKDSLK